MADARISPESKSITSQALAARLGAPLASATCAGTSSSAAAAGGALRAAAFAARCGAAKDGEVGAKAPAATARAAARRVKLLNCMSFAGGQALSRSPRSGFNGQRESAARVVLARRSLLYRVALSQARANLSELADQVKAGAEKIITKNGESYVALIDAQRLDYYHQLERERIHLLLLDEASKGLADVAAGRVKDARSALSALQRRRAAKAAG